jgi:hypothetical protein
VSGWLTRYWWAVAGGVFAIALLLRSWVATAAGRLRADELISGNALIETTTFLAILGGTLLGGLVVLADGGIARVSALVVAIAVAGWLASLFILPTRAAAPGLHVG